ncbi:MAG TPA: hypothetical protein VM074_03460 [Solimonas sp.]|nr:hypothetical protein [Solimonas sp.]
MPADKPFKHRAALLAAGREIAERDGLKALTAARLCTAAKVGERAFKRQYPAMNAFLLDLAEVMLDEARDLTTRLTHNMPAGVGRLKLAMETYLSANQQRPVLREIMRDLRGDDAVEALVKRRLVGFTMMTQLELRRVKWPNAEITARLLTTAALETIFAEFEAGRALPEYRDVMFRYLDSRPA